MSNKSDIAGLAAIGVLGYIFIKKVGNVGNEVSDSVREVITNNSVVEKYTDIKETAVTNWNTKPDTTRIYSQAGANSVQKLEGSFHEILNAPIHTKSHSKSYTLGGTDFNNIKAVIGDNKKSMESLKILDKPKREPSRHSEYKDYLRNK